MRRILLIIMLFAINLLSYRYLSDLLDHRLTLKIAVGNKPIIFQKKAIEFYDLNEFAFDDYFTICSFNDVSYLYHFNDSSIIIDLNGNHYTFPYQIREKEVIEVEKVIYKEVYVPSNQKSETESVSSHHEENNTDYEYEADYFNLLDTYRRFDEGTGIDEIISTIQSLVETNQRVYVDYSSLNPNSSGLYTVFLVTDKDKYEFFVEIG